MENTEGGLWVRVIRMNNYTTKKKKELADAASLIDIAELGRTSRKNT